MTKENEQVTKDKLTLKQRRIDTLQGLIQGEKYTVDDIKFRLSAKTKGRNMLEKMLDKHERLLHAYKEERYKLLKEINAERDRYMEVMVAYNKKPSIQKFCDEWWSGALKTIARTIADVVVIEPAEEDDEVVEVELLVFADPVEVDKCPHRRRIEQESRATTCQTSHSAHIRQSGLEKVKKRDKYINGKIKEFLRAIASSEREEEYRIKRAKEEERLAQAKVRRDNKKKNNNESHITSNTETSGTCDKAGGHHHRLGGRHQHRNGKEIG